MKHSIAVFIATTHMEITTKEEMEESPSMKGKNLEIISTENANSSCSTKYNPLPIFLKFEDVEFSVGGMSKNPMKAVIKVEGGECKSILKGITGSIGPGEVLALMGPSGSGKTTLLKVIGGRLRDNVKGKISYNDVPYNPALKRRIGFVTQDDVLLPQLTVEETLVFAASLRLPNIMNWQQKYSRVLAIIDELGLERHIGWREEENEHRIRILVDPSLLLLDEPTSGLDSTSANKLLQILQKIARGGRTVIMTIHQPSSRMFHMFDKLLLIAEGHPLYHGKARDCLAYFSSLGFVAEIAMNPAEFLLDLATGHVNDISVPEGLGGCQDAQEHEREVIKYLQWKYKTELEPKEKEEIHRSRKASRQLQMAVQVKKDWTLSWMEQFIILAKRTYRERWRDYFDVLRLIQAIGVAVLLGLLWWKSKSGTEAQLRDQVGLLFYICIFWTSTSIFGAVYVFPFEKVYLVKERKADMYKLSVYYVCSTLSDMVTHVLYPSIFMAILYFMADFHRTSSCFFMTLFAVLLIVITGQGAGELFGSAILSIKRAGLVASMFVMLILLIGGYYVQHIPKFMRWMRYASFIHYGFRLLLKVQYGGYRVYECDSTTGSGCRSLQSSPSFDTVDLNGGRDEIWIMLAMALAYRVAAYFCLKKRISLSPF
ncbi:ABC transporter G family member 26 [Acorus calamus]|uniref:ABC transporter G family member 26 n=1 Tax=Acorus calamus TaxID=4465 RepID=A0AAV9EDN0_ACOCL|nr:ABC transporter G family member 26 [Acorus calamus]